LWWSATAPEISDAGNGITAFGNMFPLRKLVKHSEHAESREISYTALKTHYMTFEGKGMAISLRFRSLSPEIPLVLLG
jgi:hypothetical protein